MKSYIANVNFRHEGLAVEPGDKIELNDSTAKVLMRMRKRNMPYVQLVEVESVAAEDESEKPKRKARKSKATLNKGETAAEE